MGKLIFRWGAMGAAKSSGLLHAAYNYRERGIPVDLYKPAIDTRDEEGFITSRIGLRAPCELIQPDTDFSYLYVVEKVIPKFIFIDEAQFLTTEQVVELRELVDTFDTTVICYGLRTDFRRQPFPASALLLSLADKMEEIPTTCWCGVKAKCVLRLGNDGSVLTDGPQVLVGGNDRYVSVCFKHWLFKQLGESDEVSS